MKAGASVWVPDETEAYVLAKVSSVDGKTLTATTKAGKSITCDISTASAHEPEDEKQSDLVQMVNVDVANILNARRKRHQDGAVYTSVGSAGIVISVNPYRKIDICAPSTEGERGRERSRAREREWSSSMVMQRRCGPRRHPRVPPY